MTESEARKFINEFAKKANSEQLQRIICGCFGPRCSVDCPLKKLGEYECIDIIPEGKPAPEEKKSEVVKEIPKKVEKSQKNLEKKSKTTLLLF